LRLFLVVAGLVGINVYFIGYRGKTSIGALLSSNRVQAPQPAEVAPSPAKKAAPLPDDPAGGHAVDGQLGDGQTIAQALAPRVGKRLASQIEDTLATAFDLGAVRAGQAFVLVYDAEDRLVAFEFRASSAVAYRVDLAAGKPALSILNGRAETRTTELVLPTGPSIWDALRRAGESPALGEQLCEVYAGDGDLCGPGAYAGERVRVVAQRRLVGGRFHRYGPILGAEWVTHAGVRRAFYFPGTTPGYYTERGDAVARTARLVPFRALRGVVTGRPTVQAQGDGVATEYAAPTGSGAAVVCALAAGTVTGITRAPAGATVTVLTDGEHHTYTHLTRLARGLQLGQKVAPGQSLGRADSAVLVTQEGERAKNGRPAPRQAALTAAERPRFGEAIAPVLERLRDLALRPSDPLASRGLSAIP
jgi:hypothetical protein